MVSPELLTPYPVILAGIPRQLHRVEIAPGVVIAILNILGDTELTEAVAQALVDRLPDGAEFLAVPEAKAIPLCYAMSVKSRLPYCVLRKSYKAYMTGSLSEPVVSITTGEPQTLWLDGKDLPRVRDRNVVLVDDVISTGGTLRSGAALLERAGANVLASCAIMTEGDPGAWSHVIALGNLPVWVEPQPNS